MDLKKEKLKMKIYLTLYIIFLILTFAGAGYVISNKGETNPGFAIVSMLFGLIFIGLYRDVKKKIKDNK